MTAIQSAKISDYAAQTTLSFLQDLFGPSSRHDFSVRLWDGTTWQPEPDSKTPPRFMLVLQHPGALRSMFLPPNELNLFEAYIYNDFDVEGDIESLIAMLDQLIDERGHIGKLEQLRLGKRLLSLPKIGRPRPTTFAIRRLSGKPHSKQRDRQVISYHYDQSNDFYALWLDRYMLYSCAYFASPDEDLDSAQERKLEYLCRKLRLKAGERLLDIGCGWGALLIYAAQHYGVSAHGITLSQQQAELAQKRIAEAGLTDRCSVEICDYRDLNKAESYDKIASIGVVEHVGAVMLPTYFKQAWHLLRPGGVFLNHITGCTSPSTSVILDQSNYFGRYIFPDAELMPISLVLRAAEMSGFEVRDVESLREHDVLMLRHWRRRLEAHADEVRNLASDTTYRIYRLYTAAGAHGFETSRITNYHALLAKPNHGHSHLPLTRTDWYV